MKNNHNRKKPYNRPKLSFHDREYQDRTDKTVSKIKPSKIFEVYETIGRRRQLYTLNLVPGKQVYGEKLVVQDEKEYREWNVSKSKLAALILKGASNVFIRKNDWVLYLGCSSGTTVSHVSDIIGKEGLVFAVDLSPVMMREMVFLAEERPNIAPILESANHTDKLNERIAEVDVIYQDLAQRNQVDIFLKNVSLFLKQGGYCMLAVKSRSIDVTKKPKDIYQEVRKRLEKELAIIDFRELDPFQKDHCMFICKKK